MARFVLVHGAWHDAWCWGRLALELAGHGHEVVTVDLPSDDPGASFEDYADAVADAMPVESSDWVVLVGHSLAGLTIPLVPETRRRVDHLVYLCALPPVPGMSFLEQLESEQGMLDLGYADGLGEVDPEGRRAWVDRELARVYLYADCDDQTVDEALAHLRPQAQTPYLEPCSLADYPRTPASYVVCSDDRLVNPAWSRTFAVERLRADLIELPGSHSPFLSRPAELAAALARIARPGHG